MGNFKNSFFTNFTYDPSSIAMDYEVWNFLYEILFDKYYKNEIYGDKFIEVLECLYDYEMPPVKSFLEFKEQEKYLFSMSLITDMMKKIKKEKEMFNSKKK